MSTTTTARFVSILERSLPIPAGRVDRQAGVIRGCKIIGVQSFNSARVIGMTGPGSDQPYSYSPEALRRAAPLYEGTPVFIDHPPFHYRNDGSRTPSTAERKLADKFGVLRNVQARPDGLYGDLVFLTSHPLANQVCEAAEKMPSMFCLSHNASGLPVLRGGRYVIDELSDVRSVDLVGAKGGTNSSLFESSNPNLKGKKMDDSNDMIPGVLDNFGEAVNNAPETLAAKIQTLLADVVLAASDEKVAKAVRDLLDKHDNPGLTLAGKSVDATETLSVLRGGYPFPKSSPPAKGKPRDISTPAKALAALRGL